MERVGLGLWCLRPVPNYVRNIPSVIYTERRSSLDLSVPHVESEACAEVLKCIQKGYVRYCAYNFAVHYDEEDWFDPDPRWVAAVIRGGDIQRMIPENVFAKPRLPAPCYGIVPGDRPIHVGERPQGDVVSVGFFEYVFSSRICRLLAAHGPATLGQVVYRGQVLEDWHRFLPQNAQAVIDDSTFDPFQCAACGTEGRRHHQAFVGLPDLDLNVAREQVGLGHSDLEHPYLISLEIAAKLIQEQFTFDLEPIINAECDVGQAILRAAPILNAHQQPLPHTQNT